MSRVFYGKELSEVAWIQKWNELYKERPDLHGCSCSPVAGKPGLWRVTLTGATDTVVEGFPLLEALDRCLKKWEKKPTPSRWSSREEYRKAWAEVGQKAKAPAAAAEPVKRSAPIRIIPTFKALPKKGKALEVEKKKQERAANSKDAWSLF